LLHYCVRNNFVCVWTVRWCLWATLGFAWQIGIKTCVHACEFKSVYHLKTKSEHGRSCTLNLLPDSGADSNYTSLFVYLKYRTSSLVRFLLTLRGIKFHLFNYVEKRTTYWNVYQAQNASPFPLHPLFYFFLAPINVLRITSFHTPMDRHMDRQPDRETCGS
jgi:hypothetical protein